MREERQGLPPELPARRWSRYERAMRACRPAVACLTPLAFPLLCAGMANTALLQGTRGDLLAAIAPVAAGGAELFRQAKPRPVLHIAGRNDAIVNFRNQEHAVDVARRINSTDRFQPCHTPQRPAYSGDVGVTAAKDHARRLTRQAGSSRLLQVLGGDPTLTAVFNQGHAMLAKKQRRVPRA